MGWRLGVFAGNCRHQQTFKNLMIGQRFGAAVKQPLSQACAVANLTPQIIGGVILQPIYAFSLR